MKPSRNQPLKGAFGGRAFSGGEGGIRTRVPFRETRSPGVRARPDYATSPVRSILQSGANYAMRIAAKKQNPRTGAFVTARGLEPRTD